MAASVAVQKNYESKNNYETQENLWFHAKNGDSYARECLVEENMPLVTWVVKRFLGRNCEMEDLMQVGIIGLLKAIDNFEPSYNNKFSTYAVPMIMGEVRRHLRDDGILHLSRSYKELAGKIKKAGEKFYQIHGREPSIAQLAEILNCSTQQIVVAMEANLRPASLQSPLDKEDTGGELIDVVASPENEDNWVDNIALKEVFHKLPTRLKYIMEARYFKEQTQEEIAKVLGVSQVQVSRLEKQALARLKELF